jgi:hypothetical protein
MCWNTVLFFSSEHAHFIFAYVSLFLSRSFSLTRRLSPVLSLPLSLSLPCSCSLVFCLACTRGCTRVHFLSITHHRWGNWWKGCWRRR